jgi:DNA-binding HxlR family transcriptional regulator
MVPMEHSLIVASLDENWRTVVEIRGRLGGHSRSVGQLAATLRQLADEGHIERVERETPAPKRERRGLAGRLSIQLYRRRCSPAFSEN